MKHSSFPKLPKRKYQKTYSYMPPANKAMTTEHFVIKDGVLRWIKDMPVKAEILPDSLTIQWEYDEWYKQALQSAIDNSIEVSNQEEVARKLQISGTYSKALEGQIYELNCRVEVKDVPDLIKEGWKNDYIRYGLKAPLKQVAHVTFPSENKELGEAERVEEVAVTYGFDDKNFVVKVKGETVKDALCFFIKHYAFDSIHGYKTVIPTDNDA